MPHPLELMRYLARGWGTGERLPGGEVASVLAEVAADSPSSLLQACRRLIERHPASGVAWWLAARALSALGPAACLRQDAHQLSHDPTARRLAQLLPARVALAGRGEMGEVTRAALGRRRDVSVVRSPLSAGCVLVEAWAAGPEAVLVSAPEAALVSKAALALAGPGGRATPPAQPAVPAPADGTGQAGVPVWAVVARGTLLPGPLWEALLGRLPAGAGAQVVAAGQLASVVSERGLEAPAVALAAPTCPPVVELLDW